MYRDEVIAILRAHEPELRAAGVEHLRLFGSVARGEETSESDVDVAADFASRTLLNMLKFAEIQALLSELLGAQVDLSERQYLRSSVRENFDREEVLVY